MFCFFSFLLGENCKMLPTSWFNIAREAPVRFGYGSGVERFERFRLSVPAVPLQERFSVFQYSLTGKDGSGFGSWKTVPEVPVPLSVSGKTVPTVPVRFLSHPVLQFPWCWRANFSPQANIENKKRKIGCGLPRKIGKTQTKIICRHLGIG